MARRILTHFLLLVASFLLHGVHSPKVVPAGIRSSPSEPAAIALAAGRGVARDARVLPRAGPDHQAADPREGVHRRGRRGRLAGRLSRQPLRPRPRRRRRGRSTRWRGFRRFPAWMWRNADVLDFVGWLRDHNDAGRPGATQGRLLRPGPLQPARLDGGGARLPGQGRSRGGRAGPAPLRLLRPLRRGHARPTATPPGSASAQSCERRGRSRSSSSCAGPPPSTRCATAGSPRTSYFFAEQNARLVRDAEEYYRTMFRGRGLLLEPARPPHGRDARRAGRLPGAAGGRAEGRRVGPQLAPRRRAGDADGRPGRVERRPARARAVRPRRRAGRLHHLRRHGDGGLELGRAGRAEAGPTGPAGQLRGALPRRRPGPVPAGPPRRRPAWRACASRGWSGPSA